MQNKIAYFKKLHLLVTVLGKLTPRLIQHLLDILDVPPSDVANGFQKLANATKSSIPYVAAVLDSHSELKKILEKAEWLCPVIRPSGFLRAYCIVTAIMFFSYFLQFVKN